jgi:hypothetical protein
MFAVECLKKLPGAVWRLPRSLDQTAKFLKIKA